MQTRSQTNTILNKFVYEVVIDFDGASEAWKANKKTAGNGTYTYVCQKKTIIGNSCAKKCLAGKHFCKIHV
jgi:hypothetical protein